MRRQDASCQTRNLQVLEELTRAVAYSRSTGTKVSERLRHLPMSDEEIARDILDYAQKSQCTSETAATGN